MPATKTKTRLSRAPRRPTHEEQAAEILELLERRQRRMYEALLMLLSVRDEKLLRAFAIVLDFVVGLTERGPR